MTNEYQRSVEAVTILADKSRIVIFSGSGLSAASGIPTFGDEHDPLVDYGIERWETDPRWRDQVWSMILGDFWAATPNAGHRAVKRLVEACVATHVTSNIDGLVPGIEVCGSVRRVVCPDCHATPDIEDVRRRWVAGKPLVCDCGGTLRPDVVFVGETFPIEPIERAHTAVLECDALLLVGVSELIGTWIPALEFCVDEGIPVVVINPDPSDTQVEGADVVLRERAEAALPAIVDRIQGGTQ